MAKNNQWIAWVAVIALILAVIAVAVVLKNGMTGNAILTPNITSRNNIRMVDVLNYLGTKCNMNYYGTSDWSGKSCNQICNNHNPSQICIGGFAEKWFLTPNDPYNSISYTIKAIPFDCGLNLGSFSLTNDSNQVVCRCCNIP